MGENEEKIAAQEKKLARQNELKGGLSTHVSDIRKNSELLASLTAIEVFQEADLDNAFEITDAIQDSVQEIIALLFDLRDNI